MEAAGLDRLRDFAQQRAQRIRRERRQICWMGAADVVEAGRYGEHGKRSRRRRRCARAEDDDIRGGGGGFGEDQAAPGRGAADEIGQQRRHIQQDGPKLQLSAPSAKWVILRGSWHPGYPHGDIGGDGGCSPTARRHGRGP